jgi:hypothetical protein
LPIQEFESIDGEVLESGSQFKPRSYVVGADRQLVAAAARELFPQLRISTSTTSRV